MTVGLQHFLHAPALAKPIVDASETIPCADVEKICEFVLYLGPGELSNDALVHDEEFLLLAVRRPSGSRYSSYWVDDSGRVGAWFGGY